MVDISFAATAASPPRRAAPPLLQLPPQIHPSRYGTTRPPFRVDCWNVDAEKSAVSALALSTPLSCFRVTRNSERSAGGAATAPLLSEATQRRSSLMHLNKRLNV